MANNWDWDNNFGNRGNKNRKVSVAFELKKGQSSILTRNAAVIVALG